MSGYAVKEYKDFSGGMNDTLTPLNLKDNELIYALNVDLSEQGGFSNRKGCQKVNSASLGKLVLRYYEWTIGDQKRFIAVLKSATAETYELVRLSEAGAVLSTIHTSVAMINVFLFRNRIYFTTNGNFYAYGDFHYSPTSTSQTIAVGDIVFNKPKTTGTGVEGRFYKAKSATTLINTTNLGDTNVWEDVTDIVNTMSNQTTLVRLKPGVTDGALDNIKRCTIFAFHSKSLRVFASGNPLDPSAIYYSEPNQMNYFKNTSILYPAQNNLGKVTGLIDVMANMLVAFENGWYQWSGISVETNAEWKVLPIPHGCIATRSIVLTPYSITFLAKDGLYTMSVNAVNTDSVVVMNERMIMNQTKDKVENIMKSIVNPSQVHSVLHDNNYLLHYKDSEGFKTLVFNMDKRSFYLMNGYEIYDFAVTSSNELLYACRNFILRVEGDVDIDVLTGNLKAIYMKVKTKPYDFGENITRKFMTFMYFTFRQFKDIDVSPIHMQLVAGYHDRDFGVIDVSQSLIWRRQWMKTWGWNDYVEREAEIKLIANRFQVIFEKESLNDKTTVYAIAFRYRPMSPRGLPMPTTSQIVEIID